MAESATDMADLAARLAGASKAFAEAEKVRAESDKVRADSDKVRADTEKVREEVESARTDKLIEQATGAIPDLSGLQKNAVSMSEGRALRQSEATSLALGAVAEKVAARVRAALPARDDLTTCRLFVTAETKVAAAVFAYRQLLAEVEVLVSALGEATDRATTVLDSGLTDEVLGGEAVVVGAAVVGRALTEVASLFEIDVSASMSTGTLPAVTVQAAVIQRLLEVPADDDETSSIVVRHQWARLPDEDSPMQSKVGTLVDLDVAAAQVSARLAAVASALGDPAAALAAALREAADEKRTEAERQEAQERAADARAGQRRLAQVQDAQTRLTTVLDKARSVATRITATSGSSDDSPLASALSVEPLAAMEEHDWVLVVGSAAVESHQLIVARRILAPRIQVSTGVEVDYFLIHGDELRTAGHAAAAASYWGQITGNGAIWKRNAALEPPR